jgi:hypothetical protein
MKAIGNLDAPLCVREEELRASYRERSGLAHGRSFTGLDEKQSAMYGRLEDLLRNILRKAILDSSFARIFASDKALRSNRPLA